VIANFLFLHIGFNIYFDYRVSIYSSNYYIVVTCGKNMGTREAIKTYFKKLDSGVFARNWNAMTGRGYTGVVPATVPPTAQIYNFNGSSRETRDGID